MSCWLSELHRGIEYLSKHSPDKALVCFKNALEYCPVSNTADLAKIFFYLGVTFKKLGMQNYAVKFWSAGRKIDKTGLSSKMFTRFANDYGMAKQKSIELDDKKAFFSVQLERYLETKHSKKIGTMAEQDMIKDLLEDYWKEIKGSKILQGMAASEKYRYFKKVKIIFPFFFVPENKGNPLVPVNFRKKTRIKDDDRCFCGSGLPYYCCCGRTPGEEELLNGLF